MVKLRKGPVCQGTLSDGTSCEARVERAGDHCPVCLERLATSADVAVRRRLAVGTGLPGAIFELLAADADDEVRLAVASRSDCPLLVLQELEHDEHSDVRAAAAAGLSSAFAPRVLQEPNAGNLFTRAELDALGHHDAAAADDPFAPAVGPPALGQAATTDPVPAHEPQREPRHLAGRPRRATAAAEDTLFAGIDEILTRLDSLSSRLSSLESVLASTGERLGVMSDRLDGLGALPAAPEAAVAVPAATGSLLPVVHPAELGTGPIIRADIVAAAWLAVLPLLARHRGRGGRSTLSAAHEPVAGPFTAAAVAELLPARDVERAAVIEASVVDAVAVLEVPATAAGADMAGTGAPLREGRRRHSMHARRRGR